MFIFATLKTNKIRYYEKKLNLCFIAMIAMFVVSNKTMASENIAIDRMEMQVPSTSTPNVYFKVTTETAPNGDMIVITHTTLTLDGQTISDTIEIFVIKRT